MRRSLRLIPYRWNQKKFIGGHRDLGRQWEILPHDFINYHVLSYIVKRGRKLKMAFEAAQKKAQK